MSRKLQRKRWACYRNVLGFCSGFDAALRSLFELKDIDTSKPVDLYFGPTAPKDGEGRWIKTQSGRDWFSYIRIHGPTQPAFDGSWKPNDSEEIK